MSLHVLSPETVWNRGLLDFPTAPRKILERGTLLPRAEASWAFVGRVTLENQLLRFLLALLPFGVAALVWPAMALPISQAPIVMLVTIGIVELRVLRVPRKRRAAVTTETAAARTLDALNDRGRQILSRLAAERGIERGLLYLVIEQSDIARLPPLTIVSVQTDHGRSRLLPLTRNERQMIRETLFDSDRLSERALLRANVREGVALRAVSFEARGVTAHARLAAFLDRTAPADAAPA